MYRIVSVISLPSEDTLKQLGEPIVKSSFDNLQAEEISSPTARRVIKRLAKKWKDYSRAALILMSCKAVGGDPALAVPVAKALVLMAGAFDLHDDIVDSSFTRSEKKIKSTLGIYGRDVCLLVGDCLLIEGMSQLHDLCESFPKSKVFQVMKAIKKGLYELGSAEIEELKLVRNLDVTPKKYLSIVRMKAADVESCTRIGGIIGGGTKNEIDSLGEFGRLLGMIVILKDDIDDTFNDKAELASRINNQSLPLPIVYSLSDKACSEELQKIFNSHDAVLDELLSIIESNKGFEKTKSQVEKYVSTSKNLLQQLRYPSDLLSLYNP